MSNSKLIELSYYDPSAQVRLSAYADTLVLDHDQNGSIIRAIRFGGYPEMVRAMADAIYGGATIEAAQNDTTRMLQSSLKSYQRQITHDGIYAVATLMAADTVQEDDRSGKHEKDEDTNLVDTEQMELQPRRCYVFCPAGDQKRLFEELDRKTAAPLIPEFQDYVLSSLRQRGDLRQLEVISLKERMDAWVLDLKPQDQNVVEVLEQGLQSGAIQIPGAVPNMPDGFENVENVTGYADTMQAKAMKLMASKLAVAGIIEGTFSEEGLAAMSDVKDLTSQMAKELALGIRDNVEDIAAAFRKMAVMNPERKKNIAAAQLKETAAEEQKAPAAKDSFGVRTAQAQVRQALYEGLLARTAEEQKKRKSKKAEVDENQLSIFGFAA